MKKFAAILLTIIFLLSLTACGKGALNQSSSDALSAPSAELTFLARVHEITDTYAMVEPLEGEDERSNSDKITFGIKNIDISAKVGDIIKVTYDGVILESYPAQITASKCEMHKATDRDEFKQEWLDKQTAIKSEEIKNTSMLVIDKIYSNCFIASFVDEHNKYAIKINGLLPDDVCKGDRVYVTYYEIYIDDAAQRIECDFIDIRPIDDIQ